MRRVSSQATRSASRSADSTRRVMSSRLPIGVGQTMRRPVLTRAALQVGSRERRRSAGAGGTQPLARLGHGVQQRLAGRLLGGVAVAADRRGHSDRGQRMALLVEQRGRERPRAVKGLLPAEAPAVGADEREALADRGRVEQRSLGQRLAWARQHLLDQRVGREGEQRARGGARGQRDARAQLGGDAQPLGRVDGGDVARRAQRGLGDGDEHELAGGLRQRSQLGVDDPGQIQRGARPVAEAHRADPQPVGAGVVAQHVAGALEAAQDAVEAARRHPEVAAQLGLGPPVTAVAERLEHAQRLVQDLGCVGIGVAARAGHQACLERG